MRAASLFAGIGGFDLAAQRCGVDAAVQVEIDAFCQRVLAKRFPRAQRFKDVREVTEAFVTHALTGEGQVPAVGVRRLMPCECEKLQAFPVGWTCLEDHPQQCDCPDSPRYRALGNAVCVNVVQWIIQRLVAVDAASLEQAA